VKIKHKSVETRYMEARREFFNGLDRKSVV